MMTYLAMMAIMTMVMLEKVVTLVFSSEKMMLRR